MRTKFSNDQEFDAYIAAMCERLGWEINDGIPFDEDGHTVSEYCTRFPNSWNEIQTTLEHACEQRKIDLTNLEGVE